MTIMTEWSIKRIKEGHGDQLSGFGWSLSDIKWKEGYDKLWHSCSNGRDL